MGLVSKLRENGYRITKARVAICEILENAGHFHMTAEEIFELVKKKSRVKIDRTTVYRTLESLEELRLINHALQPHKSGYYFLNKENLNVHIICKSCNKIFDLSKNTQKEILKKLEKESEFSLIDSNYLLRGYCKNCR